MKLQILRWLTFAVLLTAALALAACGGGNSSPTQAPAGTTARRTPAPTKATGGGAQPTQDTLNDSNSDTGDAGDDSGTPDQLNDSPNKTPNQATSAPAATGPQTKDGKIVLTDTLWNLDSAKQIYRFCKSGRWDVLQGGSTVIKTGTYQSDGDNVTVKNNADQKSIKYQITWKPDTKTVDLKDGNTTLTLTYTAAANCK